jgi:hypothetical protein
MQEAITKEKLEKVYQLSDEILSLNEKVMDCVATVKEQNGDKEHEITRDDGEKVKLKEKILWIELRQMGAECVSGKQLRELYPDIFAMSEKADALSKELEAYTTEHFGINHTTMTIANLFRLSEGMVEYVLDKKTKEITQKAN